MVEAGRHALRAPRSSVLDLTDACHRCGGRHGGPDELTPAQQRRWVQVQCDFRLEVERRHAEGFRPPPPAIASAVLAEWPAAFVTRTTWMIQPTVPVTRSHRLEVRSPVDGVPTAALLVAIQLEVRRRSSMPAEKVVRDVLSLSRHTIRSVVRSGVALACGGTTHVVGWDGGTRLHIGPPADEAEHVLAVLRGDVACERAAAAWGDVGNHVVRRRELPEPLGDALVEATRLAETRERIRL